MAISKTPLVLTQIIKMQWRQPFFAVILIGIVAGVSLYYYGAVNAALTVLGADASCSGFGSGSAAKGDASCYAYISSKNRYRVYPNQVAKPVTIRSYITDLGGSYIDETCSTSTYCLTPHDSDLIVVIDAVGHRDCVDRGVVARDGGYNGSGCGQLVGYYPLDGNPNDYSGNVNNGTVHGAAATTMANGVDDYIDINNPPQFQLIDNFTVGAWVKLSAEEGWYGIVGKMKFTSQPNEMHGWMLYRGAINQGHQYRFTVGDGAWPPYYSESENPSPDNEWHYITGVKQGTAVRVYVDGVQRGMRFFPSESTADSGEYVSIGKQYSYHELAEQGIWSTYGYALGIIDEVKIWNYVLSNEEILAEYERAN